jgi:hypothetical protein
MGRFAIAAVLILATAPACDGDEPTEPANPVRAAAAATAAAGSARYEMTHRIAGGSPELVQVETATGVADWSQDAGTMHWTARFDPLLEGAEQPPPVWTVWDDDFMYWKGERVTQEVPGDPEWIRLSYQEVGVPVAVPGVGEDPSRAFEYLWGASAATEEVGPATVRGIDTTRYEAELDRRSVLRLAPDPDVVEEGLEIFGLWGHDDPVPVEVWLDGTGRMVRLRVEGRDGDSRVTFTVELWDFGVDAAIETPRDAKAVSITDTF